MSNVYKTKIDIKDTRPDFKPIFVQYDHARLEIVLTDNGQTYDLTNVNRVEFTHVKNDKSVIIHPGEIVTIDDEKIIVYEYRGSEMDSLGTVKTSFAVFDSSNKKVSSHTFDVAITKDLRDEIFAPAQPHIGKLQTLIEDVEFLKLYGGGGDGTTIVPGPAGKNGKDGEKGDPFTYSDFTKEQLEALRGPQGPPGSDANVTNENVLSAIGFTPVNSADIGSVGQLETTNKTIVSAINEVKQYANNGKSEIVSAVIGKGGTATINDSFSNLANAIANIPMGKKLKAETFGLTKTLNVTSLDFKPSIVLVRGIDSTTNRYLFKMHVDLAMEGYLTKQFNDVVILVQRTAPEEFITDVLFDYTFVTRSNGFSITSPNFNVSGFWVAIE